MEGIYGDAPVFKTNRGIKYKKNKKFQEMLEKFKKTPDKSKLKVKKENERDI